MKGMISLCTHTYVYRYVLYIILKMSHVWVISTFFCCKRKVILQDCFIRLYLFKDLRATLYPYYLMINPLKFPAKTSPIDRR